MTKLEVIQFIRSERVNVDTMQVMDEVYALPDRDWILGPFSDSFAGFLRERGILAGATERNDCDDFAIHALSHMRVLNARSNRQKAACAFGLLTFIKDGTGGIGHAINFGIVRVPSGRRLMFYEPQTRQEISLSTGELYLCDFYLI